MLELSGFQVHCQSETGHFVQQRKDLDDQRNLYRCRINIVRGLRGVHVVQGVDVVVITFFEACYFKRSICDYLVGIHVGAGASTTLDGVNCKLCIQLAITNLEASFDDWVGYVLG